MNETNRSPNFVKSRRNFSDPETNFLRLRNLNDLEEEGRGHRPKANSIKINRSKLPPDFFPRSESVKKKINANKASQSEEANPFLEYNRKANSERNYDSPEKTSFFGFFEEQNKGPKNQAYTMNLKRKFESREEPKRERVMLEPRHFTPVNKAQRVEILDLFPASHDEFLSEAIANSKKGKHLQISPRKEHMRKYHQAKQVMHLDPEKEEEGGDLHNITFFNAKSTSFPPINKNKSSA